MLLVPGALRRMTDGDMRVSYGTKRICPFTPVDCSDSIGSSNIMSNVSKPVSFPIFSGFDCPDSFGVSLLKRHLIKILDICRKYKKLTKKKAYRTKIKKQTNRKEQ